MRAADPPINSEGRFRSVADIKARLSAAAQTLPDASLRPDHAEEVVIFQQSLKRRLARAVGPTVLALQRPYLIKKIGFTIPFDFDLLCLGQRFAEDSSMAFLLKSLGGKAGLRLLVYGCSHGGGEDVQFWLRQGIKKLDGVELYSFRDSWNRAQSLYQSHYGAAVRFSQATAESLPYENESFDFLVSCATLEHVRRLDLAIEESARVLKPGGWAWHAFGPLYYSFGGDHCIASYGADHGYDHLLLTEAEYRIKINDDAFFGGQTDPNCSAWAKTDQFSFYKTGEYVDLFKKHFVVENMIVKVAEEGLRFRKEHPERWTKLRAMLSECDLLVSGMSVLLRKRN